jgi:hypothetical protein
MKNYKYKHITIIILAIGIIMVTLLPSGGINNFLCGAFAVIAGMLSGKVEKGDELTEKNIAKANKITLYVLVAVLVVATMLGDDNFRLIVKSYIPGILAAVAIALRSVLFLFFDRSPADSEVDE